MQAHHQAMPEAEEVIIYYHAAEIITHAVNGYQLYYYVKWSIPDIIPNSWENSLSCHFDSLIRIYWENIIIQQEHFNHMLEEFDAIPERYSPDSTI